ncbi:hypothetical protein ACLK1T_18180 [Escherichia coli]
MPLAFAPALGEICRCAGSRRFRPFCLVPSQCVTGVIAQSYHQSEKSASEFNAMFANGAVPCRQWSSPRILIAGSARMDTIAARK